jgi:hypothetical protein
VLAQSGNGATRFLGWAPLGARVINRRSVAAPAATCRASRRSRRRLRGLVSGSGWRVPALRRTGAPHRACGRGRTRDAIEHTWATFSSRPSLETYRQLAIDAKALGEWDERRTAALTMLHARGERDTRERRRAHDDREHPPSHEPANHSACTAQLRRCSRRLFRLGWQRRPDRGLPAGIVSTACAQTTAPNIGLGRRREGVGEHHAAPPHR